VILFVFLVLALGARPVFASAPLNTQGSIYVSTNNFEGLNQLQNGAVPPDVQLAVGPNYAVEVTNFKIGIFSKATFSLVASYNFCQFSATCGGFDPKILYDSSSGRFFLTTANYGTASVNLAVSNSSDPTIVPWASYPTLLNVGSGNCPDSDRIGVTDDKIIVSALAYTAGTSGCSSGFNTVQDYWVVKKSDLTSGISSPAVQGFSDSSSNLFFANTARSLTSTTTGYLVAEFVDGTALSLVTITGVPPNVPTPVKTTIPLATRIAGEMGAPQPGTNATVPINGNIINDVVWYGGNLWITANDGCTPSGDSQQRDCLRLTQINTNSPVTVRQDFDFGTNGKYYFDGALSTDASGNLEVVYGFSSTTDYPSIGVVGQDATNPAGTLSLPQTILVGTKPDLQGRYGDYFGASTDPTSIFVWFAGEYFTDLNGTCPFSYCWSTRIGYMMVAGVSSNFSPPTIYQSYQTVCKPMCHTSPNVMLNSTILTLSGFNGYGGTVTATISPFYSSAVSYGNLHDTSERTSIRQYSGVQLPSHSCRAVRIYSHPDQ